MHRLRRSALVALPALLVLVLSACAPLSTPSTVEATTISGKASAADCPPGLHCVVHKAALVDAGATGDGTCSYSPLGSGVKRLRIDGIVEHTTEGSLASALVEIKNPTTCLSWNYLVDTDGTIYINVPPGNQTFTANNRYFNTQYIQVENVGHAAACDISKAQLSASAKLAAYLGKRFGFTVSGSSVFGHDSVPGINDATQASQHWDPGICWDWSSFYKQAGASNPSANPSGNAVTITRKGGGKGENSVYLHTGPSTSTPLVGDPYLHDGGSGTTANDDWGSKTSTGHTYAVANTKGTWIGIWFGGRVAWFDSSHGASKRVSARTVTPKTATVAVYGRPMPSSKEFSSSKLPASVIRVQNLPASLTRYTMKQGQSYVLVSSDVRNQFFEGCDKTDCSGPFDGTVVNGKEKYLEIEWNHRYVFVKASDVSVHGG